MRRVAIITVLPLVCVMWAGALAAQPMGGWAIDRWEGGGPTTLIGASGAGSQAAPAREPAVL
jgi:hypothetical protein